MGDQVELSDSLLLDGLRQGDAEAFSALFVRYHSSVYRVLLRLLGRPDDAEDLTQETFVKLYHHPLANGREHNVKAWLYRVALNLGYNTLRAERRRGERQEKAALVESANESGVDPAGVALRSEERQLVRRVLSEMSDNYQACLVLRHDGLSYAHIADVLGIAPNAVGTVLVRAEKQFKARYLQQLDGPGRDGR